MTNEQVLDSKVGLELIEKNYFSSESKCVIPEKLLYASQKIVRQCKPIVTENEEMYKDFQKAFKEVTKFDEKKMETDKEYEKSINDKYKDFLDKKDQADTIKAFKEKECTIDFYNIDKELLDEPTVLPNFLIEILEKFIKE